MINDELIKKIESIEDLPISEEMLGAYMEGSTSSVENCSIEQHIADSASFALFVSDVKSPDVTFWRNANEKSEDYVIDLKGDEIFNNVVENIEIMENLTRTYNTYGENSENILDPVYIQQPDDHSCALRSQQIVLRDYGIDIPFKELEEIALSNGVYSEQGTYTYDIGKVLEIAGVGMHQVQGSTIYDLTNELVQGHRVIVSVDAYELWNTDTWSKLRNWFRDVIGKQGGNHALIVAGIKVNPDNPNDVQVVLTDPGAGHLRVEYPLDQFMDAWKDSNCFMAATNEPAPYQYDPETKMEIPSNFMIQQYVNEFISSNGYQLNPDLINIPQDYHPAFTGHLDMVGNMPYADFEQIYNDILDYRMPSTMTVKAQIEEVAKRHESNPAESLKKESTENEININEKERLSQDWQLIQEDHETTMTSSSEDPYDDPEGTLSLNDEEVNIDEDSPEIPMEEEEDPE